MVRFLLPIVTILFISGCNELASFKYDPYPDVAIVLKLNKVSYHENRQGKSTYVHILYSIDHKSDEHLTFEVEKIKVTINDISSVHAYYDNIGSITPFPRRIVEDKAHYDIYVVFPGTMEVTKDIKFSVLDFGLNRELNKRNPLAPFDRSFELPLHPYQLKQASQQKSKNLESLITTMMVLNVNHPEMDVERNISGKDLRFIGINGFGCYAPGVEKDDLALTETYGIRCLDGTSDVIENEEHGRLIQTAIKYAQEYNHNLLMKLRSK